MTPLSFWLPRFNGSAQFFAHANMQNREYMRKYFIWIRGCEKNGDTNPRSPVPGSNLGPGPPHSVVWGATDHTVILSGLGIRSFTHRSLLICSFLSNQISNCERLTQIAQDKWATGSESGRSLMSKERQWANRSGRSWQMSDRERFAQVAHQKWAKEQFLAKKSKISFF